MGSLGSELPDPAWLNPNYRQQAGNGLQPSQPPCVCTLGWLASNTQLTQKQFWNWSVPTDCQGQQSCLAQSRPTVTPLFLKKLRDPVGGLSLCASFLYQAKGLFLALDLSSHILPFKERSVGSVASTHSNSLLIQRLQKKKITGTSLLFPPSLSPGLHFSRFSPPEFILTITRQQS